MVANALSAEAAGRCFRAWHLMARLPGGKKDGQLARHRARLRWTEGVGGLAPAWELPQTCWVGCEQVQEEGPCWRGQVCLSLSHNMLSLLIDGGRITPLGRWTSGGPSHACFAPGSWG